MKHSLREHEVAYANEAAFGYEVCLRHNMERFASYFAEQNASWRQSRRFTRAVGECFTLIPCHFAAFMLYYTQGGDNMKKILLTFTVVVFVFGALFVAGLGIRSFYIAQTQTYNMQEVKSCITEKEEWSGRNPSLTLYTKDIDTIYEIPSIWYNEFDVAAFNDNFVCGKEYRLIVNNYDNVKGSQVIYIYGIADEYQEYLSSEDAVTADKSNSIAGLIVGLAVLCGIVVLAVATFINRKSVVDFLKEFYGRK